MDSTQPVTLSTQTAYPIPSQKFLIPTSWKRYQLSQLINKVLELPKPVPFDFLVKGELLRSTLAGWCAQNGVGEEETLEIEYVESVLPPRKMNDVPHEDWVSSVSCQLNDLIITASYDGSIRFFDYSRALRSHTPIHNAPITSLSLLSQHDDNTSYTIVSASHDLTAQISQITLPPSPSPSSDDGPSSTGNTVLASLHLHTAPLSSVDSNGTKQNVLTASWDGLICFWDTSIPSSDEVPDPAALVVDRVKKKRRTDGGGGADRKPIRKAPLAVLKSHTARVSKAIFARSQQNKAYSCGFDSTIRSWDMEYGTCDSTKSASEKPFLDLAISEDDNYALATSTDRTLTMYDLRSSTSSTSTAAASSFLHPSTTPSCLAISDTNPSHVVTGAYDGFARVWDLRSTKDPVAKFEVKEGGGGGAGGGKVLCVDWKFGLVSLGGEFGLQIWKFGQ